jgi:hypothetical protein
LTPTASSEPTSVNTASVFGPVADALGTFLNGG